MTSGNEAQRAGRQVTPPGEDRPTHPQTPSRPPRIDLPVPSPFTATMAMLRNIRTEKEDLEREKAMIEKRESDVRERDEAIKTLGDQFIEWNRDGANPNTKPTVDDEMFGKLMGWLGEAEKAQALGIEKDKHVEELERLVADLSNKLNEKDQRHTPEDDISIAPLPTNNNPSDRTTGDSSSSSSSVPFIIRRSGGDANELPIPHLIRENARLGQLVPLSALTRSALNGYISSPLAVFKTEIDGKKVSIASLKRSTGLSLEDLRYATKRWLSLQKAQLYDSDMYALWEALLNKIMSWDDLPEEFEGVTCWLDDYMARWVGDHFFFDAEEAWSQMKDPTLHIRHQLPARQCLSVTHREATEPLHHPRHLRPHIHTLDSPFNRAPVAREAVAALSVAPALRRRIDTPQLPVASRIRQKDTLRQLSFGTGSSSVEPRKGKPFAGNTNSVAAAEETNPVYAALTPPLFTHARSVHGRITSPSTVRRKTNIPFGVADIVTPYNADAFHYVLGIAGLETSFPLLSNSIRYGFTMGDLPPILDTETPPNSSSIAEHKEVIDEWAKEELTLGRLEGPYSRLEVETRLGGSFRSSPLGVVEKPDKPGKFRIVRNTSFRGKTGISVNDSLDSDDFPTQWGTAALVGDFIATAPPGTIAASVDVEAAFRTIPIIPSQWKYIVVRIEDDFFIDKCLPFGITTAVGVHGETVDALAGILKWMGFSNVFKWVDDTTIWQVPSSSTVGANGMISYTYRYPDLEPVFNLANHLGVPLHPDKVQQFGTRITYVGFDWDIENKTVSLPEKKRLKYLNKVASFLSTYAPHGTKLHLKPMESIHGSLMHCTFVIMEGRSHLKATQRFMHSFKGSHRSAYFLAASVVTELKWWETELSRPNWARPLQPLPLDDSLKIYVDASSSWGIGLVFAARDGVVYWDGWRGREGWLNGSDRTINWAEEIGLELALLAAVELGLSGRRVVIWGDNNVAIGALRNGATPNIPMNLSIRRTLRVQAVNNIVAEPLYVATEENLADGASRGIPAASYRRYHFRFSLPDPLESFIFHV